MNYCDLEAILIKYGVTFNHSLLDSLFFIREINEFIDQVHELGYENGVNSRDYTYDCCPCHS